MKSIYYNWINLQNMEELINPSIDEDIWGQFVDLETDHKINNIKPIKKYNGLIKYEPSLLTIQENVVNVPSNKIIIYDTTTTSTFLLSISILLLYIITQILFKFMTDYGSQ